MNYIKIKDIVDRILRRVPSDEFLPQDTLFQISDQTKEEYRSPENWMSIGVFVADKYIPVWDVFIANDTEMEIVKGRLKYACLRLGGKYANGYKAELEQVVS